MKFGGALTVPGVQKTTLKFIKGLKTLEDPGSVEDRTDGCLAAQFILPLIFAHKEPSLGLKKKSVFAKIPMYNPSVRIIGRQLYY